METIEITYTVFGFEEAGETTFEMDVSERTYEQLEEAEDNGEMLDQDFISSEMDGLHEKILREIRNNMEEESWNPDDGMVEKVNSWGYPYKAIFCLPPDPPSGLPRASLPCSPPAFCIPGTAPPAAGRCRRSWPADPA